MTLISSAKIALYNTTRLIPRIALIFACVLLYTYIPRIEGLMFPVSKNTVITQTVQTDEYTAFWGMSEKIRDCNYDSIVWTWPSGLESKALRVPVEVREPPKLRDAGKFTFGEWRVPLTQSEFLQNSTGYAIHRCHPFWLTETVFYKPP